MVRIFKNYNIVKCAPITGKCPKHAKNTDFAQFIIIIKFFKLIKVIVSI